jgi:6-phosphogluconolactonase
MTTRAIRSYIAVGSLVAALWIAVGCSNSSVASIGKVVKHPSPSPSPEFVYVANNVSQNVSAYVVNAVTGALAPVSGSPFASGVGPFGPTVDPAGRFAYVANNDAGSNKGTVWAYSIQATTGALTTVAGSPFQADFGTGFVAVDPSGRFAYASNYTSGDVTGYTIDASTGALTSIGNFATGTGTGASSLAIDPSGKFLYVSNNTPSGPGSVSAFAIDQTTGLLTQVLGSPFPAGTNTLQVAVDPLDRFVYATSNGSDTITSFEIDHSTGSLVPTGSLATGTDPIGVVVDPLGKLAYVALTNVNEVAAYTIDAATGTLTPLATFPAGNGPSELAIDPTDSFLYVSEEGDNTVTAYSIAKTTGTLTLIAAYPTGSDPIGVALGR